MSAGKARKHALSSSLVYNLSIDFSSDHQKLVRGIEIFELAGINMNQAQIQYIIQLLFKFSSMSIRYIIFA